MISIVDRIDILNGLADLLAEAQGDLGGTVPPADTFTKNALIRLELVIRQKVNDLYRPAAED